MKSLLSFCRLSVIMNLVQKALKPPILMAFFILMACFYESEAADNNLKPVLPPVALCKNISVQLGTGGTVTINGSDVDGGSYDPDGTITNLAVSPNTFSCSQTGSNSVVLTVTDNEGLSATCNATVTVIDALSPVINNKPFTLVLGSAGTATLLPSDIDSGTYDNCGTVTLSVSPNTFTCNDLGQKTVTLTALDLHGNSSSRNVTINVSSTLNIASMSLSTCDMSPTLALFNADIDGGDGNYSYFWRGLNTGTQPFMVIIAFPPSLIFSNTTILESPFFNNTMANGYYDIRFVVKDGNGCTDSSDIKINKTGAIFNNQTMKYSQVCEGEIKTHAVNYKSDAVYSWSVTNGTILNSNPDTSRISVRWNLGVVQGRIVTTTREPNVLFSGGQCESTTIDTVTVVPVPTPVFSNPVTSVCTNSTNTYTLTGSYPFQTWTVTGGVITSGGKISDNFITVRWGSGPAGSISVSAGNNSSCTGSVVLNVTISNLSGSIISKTDITCNRGSDGSVSVAASPGTGQAPYAYSLDGGAFQPGGIFTGIPVGNHIVQIRDASLCTFDLPFIIKQPDPVAGLVSAQTNVTCFGGNNGSVTVSGSGGVAPYEYQLGSGPFQSSGTFGSLTAGTYSISVRDANLCIFVLPVTITQSSVSLAGSIAVTNIKCFGGNSGACDLTVTGGSDPYTYLWNNGATTEDINNISAGNYSVTVTDSKGCTVGINTTVTQPAVALNVSIISKTDVSVYGGNDGNVTVSGSGGTSPYEYRLNEGVYQVSGSFGSLTAGTYIITVRDAVMCTIDLTVTITQPWIPLTANILAQVNVSCHGGNDGSFTVTGWGGTQPYLYSIDGGAFQASGTFGSLAGGNYTITVKDAALDLFNIMVTLTEPEAMEVAVSGEDVHCYGGNTGSVTASVTGGTGSYTYSWNTLPVQVTPTAAGLTAGTYTVTVTDANSCTATNTVTISQPATDMAISITQVGIMCYGTSTGSATATVSGGLAPYTYLWNTSPEQTKETATDLSAGTYSITVTDSYGCTKTGSVNITAPQPITVVPSVTPASCPDSNDGSIILAITGGTGPFTVLWSDGPTGLNRSELAPGNYAAVVTDQNNCGESIAVMLEFTYTFGCLVIPQVITPNNDGFNDDWRIRNIDLYPNAEVRVFNRWGKMVFSTRNLSDNPWDGTIGGKPAPTDSYHYILYLNDGSEPRSGVISIIR